MNQTDQYLYGLYFCILLVAILPFLKKLGFINSIKYCALWIGIFLGINIAYINKDKFLHMSSRLHAELVPGTPYVDNNTIVINKNTDGHFYVNISINGFSQKALIDTGASEVMVPYAFAKKVGLDISDNIRNFQTANGITQAHFTKADIKIADLTFENCSIYAQSIEPNMFLIGMSFLQKFSEFKFEGNKLILKM